MKAAVTKSGGRLALRALVITLAFLLFFTSSSSFAESRALPIKDQKKHRPFKPIEVFQTEVPVQRSDIFAGRLESMESAASAALIEASSLQMLLAKSPELHLPMASTTKVMTALLTLERCDLDEVIAFPKEAVGVGGSCIYAYAGEKMTIRDLLYGLMLRSGNDAAVALAVHMGGTLEGFADIMNERARLLGLSDSNFVSPNGLDREGHYSSAYDLCVISAAALQNPDFKRIVSTQYSPIQTDLRKIYVKNKNTMLWDYEGCVGVKTGYTSKAGRCLIFAAERDGMLLVGCVLNCRPMFEVAEEMLDFGFENYEMVKAVSAGTELSRCAVLNGEKSVLTLAAKSDIIIPLKKGDEMSVQVDIRLDKAVLAPVIEGERIGECELLIGGCPVGKTALIAKESIAMRDYGYYLNFLLRLFSRG
ncbi:MAG: D-alanyl-D-alanine carboxypeptidase [Clostridia bacterium]|nr:D-alanyl-D-alanine carboxypeptidase [Clostridia bacterium]